MRLIILNIEACSSFLMVLSSENQLKMILSLIYQNYLHLLIEKSLMLTHDQQRRYARHLLVPEIGEAGQEALFHAKILVIGAGGLGAASLSYLAAAGIGHIGIMDADHVELSNLNRQIIHETGDIGRMKVQSAADRLHELNPDIQLTLYPHRFDGTHTALFADYDLVIDGCDNFETRYHINHASLMHNTPWIYGAVRGWEGQLALIAPSSTSPCYRCFVPSAPHGRNDCAERGIVGAVVGVIGAMQAVTAIRALLHPAPSSYVMLSRYDGHKGIWKSATLHKDDACSDCNTHINKLA
jgi:molybdopterin/thiamine biosynthesis adenylyltransferase